MDLLENNMFRRVLAGFAALLSSLASPAMADEPDGYYEQAYGKSGYALKTALHQIIRDHASLSYDALWDAFRTTDVREDGYVWDMYSDCDFRFGSNQCGNYKQEGDCYNREHSFPKSWFDDARPMYTDLFHLYPTDGYVNGRRSNNPFGEVDVPAYTSQAGCKLGPNATPGYSGTVFEPLDEYKGDFARTYFYMATCYEDRIAGWGSCPICNGTDDQSFDDWAVDLLLKWNEQDPVSDKERARNDAVYVYQENRNPFIDYPELVEKIWGEDNTPFDPEAPDPGPDPEPEPLPDSLPSYYVAYRYVNDSGMVVASDTLHLVPLEAEYGGSLHSLFGTSGLRKAEDSVLIEEGFSGMEGSDRGSETPELEATDGYVAAFEGAVYAVNQAVRLSSSKNSGTVVFKEMAVSDSISVRISGRGWDEDELTFTVECQGGTPAQRELSFSGSDQMETLEPVSFAVDGAFVLRVHADAKQRVFLDEVLVKTGVAGDSIAPEPEPEPDPGSDTASYLRILYPLASDTLYGDSVVARIRIARLPDSLHLNGAYSLASAWLADSAVYSLHASLWFADSCLQEDTVSFVFLGKSLADSIPDSPGDTLSVQGSAEAVDFRMYPNPTSGEVSLRLPSIGRIEIYAVSGRMVRVLEADSDEVILSLSRSGVYIVRFVSKEGTAVKRLLVL